jgi:hypothetical protein
LHAEVASIFRIAAKLAELSAKQKMQPNHVQVGDTIKATNGEWWRALATNVFRMLK